MLEWKSGISVDPKQTLEGCIRRIHAEQRCAIREDFSEELLSSRSFKNNVFHRGVEIIPTFPVGSDVRRHTLWHLLHTFKLLSNSPTKICYSVKIVVKMNFKSTFKSIWFMKTAHAVASKGAQLFIGSVTLCIASISSTLDSTTHISRKHRIKSQRMAIMAFMNHDNIDMNLFRNWPFIIHPLGISGSRFVTQKYVPWNS